MTYRKIAALLIFVAGLTGFAVGQTALTQTTLASAVNGPIGAGYSGTAPSNITGDTVVFLASVAGINAPLLPGTPVSVIYVGREAMGVWSVNTSIKSVVVSRGYMSTQAAPHPSGDNVLISNVYSTTSATGANPLPSGFFQVDPPLNGSCIAANTPTTPWVNVLTGAQWLCSSITKTWVPGFNNPLNPTYSTVTAAQASVAGACTISGPLFHTTGTNACTSFTIPVGFNATASGQGQFCTIPDGAFTTTATNNIAKASTAVVNQLLCFTWDATNSKFVASY